LFNNFQVNYIMKVYQFLTNVHVYQVIMVGISTVMIFQGTKEFLRRESGQTLLKFSIRLIVWGGLALIAVYPNSTMLVARILGVEDNINAVVLTGFLLVFLIIFKLLSAIEKIEQNISELTRREALSHLSKTIPKNQAPPDSH